MASWFEKISPKISGNSKKNNVPAGIWIKCSKCGETLYSKELDKNSKVCLSCDHHFRLSARERIALLTDPGSFKETDSNLISSDPLKFFDFKKYKDRIKAAQSSSGENEAFISGQGLLEGRAIFLGVFEFTYMGGSMGSVVGEKITRLAESAMNEKKPLIIVSSSGGARMQEGIYSLMQMGKTSAALKRLSNSGIPYISILADPTTGGVTASFAMLGDLILAEPGALIGFAGQRVIRNTIKSELPKDFQRSEFLLKKGSIDKIINRKKLKSELALILDYLKN